MLSTTTPPARLRAPLFSARANFPATFSFGPPPEAERGPPPSEETSRSAAHRLARSCANCAFKGPPHELKYRPVPSSTSTSSLPGLVPGPRKELEPKPPAIFFFIFPCVDSAGNARPIIPSNGKVAKTGPYSFFISVMGWASTVTGPRRTSSSPFKPTRIPEPNTEAARLLRTNFDAISMR